MDLEDRIRSIETEILLLKLGRRQSSRLTIILVLCLLAAIPTFGISLLVLVGLLLWNRHLCGKERTALSNTDLGDVQPATPMQSSSTRKQAALIGTTAQQLKPYDFEKTLVRPALLAMGTLALLLSAAFFMALPTSVIGLTQTVRLFLIIVVGICLLFAGDSQFKRMPSFGYALLGGGLGLLIISIYGVLTSQQIPSQLLAFGLLTAVTAAMVYMSVRHNSWILAALGLCGGLLGPVYVGVRMLNHPSFSADDAAVIGDYVTVAIYLLVLATASFLLSLYRNWHFLPLLVVLFGYGVLGTLFNHVAPQIRLSALAALFLLFLLGSVYRVLRFKVAAEPLEMLVLIASCGLFMVFGMERIYSGDPATQGAIGVVCAVLLAIFAVIFPVSGSGKRLMETMCGMSVLFLGISLVFLLDTNLEAAGTMMVAILTLWLALRFASSILRTIGALAMFWALCMLLFMELLPTCDSWFGGGYIDRGTTPYLHSVFIIELVVVAGAFLALWLWRRALSQQAGSFEISLVSLGIVFTNFILVILLQVESEVWNKMKLARQAGWHHTLDRVAGVASYLVHGGILTFLGLKRESRLLRYCGLVLFAWAVLWVGFTVIVHGEMLARVIALVILGLALMAVSFWYYRRYAEAKE